MNYIQSADGTLALRLEAHEAALLSRVVHEVREDSAICQLTPDELEIISAIRNAAATLNHE